MRKVFEVNASNSQGGDPMKSRYGRRTGVTAMLVVMLVLVAAAAACSSGNGDAVDLLEDPSFGLAHLNDEFHTIKGEDLLASPSFGLAHLNDEFHAIKGTLADPKFGLAHLNDEFHTIKEMLAELAQQIESLR